MQVFTFLWSSSLSQTLQNFDIILTAEERKILISHLDLADLDGVFLTRRQKLAVQEEEYLRKNGYKPFDEKADGLQIKKSDSPFVNFGTNTLGVGSRESEDLVRDPNASLSFPISKLKPTQSAGLSPAVSPFSTPINNVDGRTKTYGTSQPHRI